MPRTPQQFEAIRKDTRHTILDAAFRLFAMKGFHAASVSAIAAEAGVSKGLMYNYFGNKEAVLQAIVGDMFEAGEEELIGILQSNLLAWDKLEALIRMSFQLVQEKPEQFRLLFGLSVQEEVWNGIRFVLKQKMTGYFQILKPILHELDVEDTTRELIFLISILDGYSLHMVTMKDELSPAKGMIDYIISQLKIKYKCDETCVICNSDADNDDGLEFSDPGPGCS